jgi:hypothetical protein
VNGHPVFPGDRVKLVPGYVVIDADLERDGDVASRVWGTTIGWPGRQMEMYRRHYLECPVDKPMLKFLRHVPTGEIVGTLGVSPRRVFWNGHEIRAGVLSHFCVVREHRKVMPARLLLKATEDACRGHFDVVYAIPGTPRAAAMVKLYGVPDVNFIVRRVKVLRHAKYLARLLPRPLASLAGGTIDLLGEIRIGSRGGTDRLSGRWVDSVDPGMAELWEASPRGSGWNSARDERMLRWRFDRLPSHRRRHLLVSEGVDGPLQAWFACDRNYFDPDILVVHDFWSAGGAGRIEQGAIRVLCQAAKQLGFSAVEMRLAAPDAVADAWVREGFVERNRMPVPTYWLNPAVAGGTKGPLHITDLDNDG